MPPLNVLALLLLALVTSGDWGLWRQVPRRWRHRDRSGALRLGGLLTGSLVASGCVVAGDPFTVMVAWFAAVKLSILAAEVAEAEPSPVPELSEPATGPRKRRPDANLSGPERLGSPHR